MASTSATATPDTAVVRNPQMSSPGVQVSARQWALLIRVKGGTTPRDLAWELNGSVFGTTAEVSRLLALRLLSVAGYPATATPASPSATWFSTGKRQTWRWLATTSGRSSPTSPSDQPHPTGPSDRALPQPGNLREPDTEWHFT